MHELRAELIHLEETHHKTSELEPEKGTHFFNHHAEAMQHTHEHKSHMQEDLDELFEALFEEELEEFLELQHRMKHVLNEIAREKYEAFEKAKKAEEDLHPHPEPSHSQKNHENKE